MHARLKLAPVIAGIPLLAACARTDGSRAPTDSPSASQPVVAAPDTGVLARTPAPANSWVVTPEGIGAIRAGLDTADLRRIGGDFTPPIPNAECSYVRPASVPPGVSVMLARGRVARIDVDSAGVRSDAGISVGDSASRVTTVYGARATATPHKYVPGGQYVTVRPVAPEDSIFRLVFETDSSRVTRFRAGRLPEVEWVERCG